MEKALQYESDINFSCCLYLAEYRLLTRCSCPLPKSHDEEVLRTQQLGLSLYIHVALRELPCTSNAAQRLVESLKASLNSDPHELYNMWRDKMLELLWIMFMGAISTKIPSHTEYFIGNATYICALEGIDNLETFKHVLKRVAWTNYFCEWRSHTLWENIEKEMLSRRQLGRCPRQMEDVGHRTLGFSYEDEHVSL